MTTVETCADCGHAMTDHAGAFGCQVERAPALATSEELVSWQQKVVAILALIVQVADGCLSCLRDNSGQCTQDRAVIGFAGPR